MDRQDVRNIAPVRRARKAAGTRVKVQQEAPEQPLVLTRSGLEAILLEYLAENLTVDTSVFHEYGRDYVRVKVSLGDRLISSCRDSLPGEDKNPW